MLYVPFRTIEGLLMANGGTWELVYNNLEASNYKVKHVDREPADLPSQENLSTQDDAHETDSLPPNDNVRLHEWMQLAQMGPNVDPRMMQQTLLGYRDYDLTEKWPCEYKGFSFSHIAKRQNDVLSTRHLRRRIQDIINIEDRGPDQRLVYTAVHGALHHDTASNKLFMILGSAGTGKSFLISAIRQLVPSSFGHDAVCITAPTGIAAFNIKGSTVASKFKIWPSVFEKELQSGTLQRLQDEFKNLKVLVLDELSFISGEVLDCLDRRLKQVFPLRSHLPFGGVVVLLFGDLYQLPPVNATPPYSSRAGLSAASLRGRLLWNAFKNVYTLGHVYRQQGDSEKALRMALHRLSRGESTREDWEMFITRRSINLTAEENKSFYQGLHIFTTNSSVKDHNLIMLEKLGSPVLAAEATPSLMRDDGNDDANHGSHDDINLLSANAPVMLTKNVFVEAGLANGARGIIRAILKENLETEGVKALVLTEFPDYCGPPFFVDQPYLVPVKASAILGKLQIPLKLAWDVTIHKSQGLTLEKATVDIGNSEFASGLSFVGLSRVRRLKDLRIVPFDFSRIAPRKNNYVQKERLVEHERLLKVAQRPRIANVQIVATDPSTQSRNIIG